jgi:hypothetical protein
MLEVMYQQFIVRRANSLLHIVFFSNASSAREISTNQDVTRKSVAL